MNIEIINGARDKARAGREAAYLRELAKAQAAYAALESSPNDPAAQTAADRAAIFLALAEAAIHHAGDALPGPAANEPPVSVKAAGISSSPSGLVANPAPVSTGAGVGSTPKQPAADPAAEIEAVAQRILASDGPADVPPSGDPELDAVAARIAASA